MKYRNLGSSNLKVSALCLGTMMFGDQTDKAEAKAIVEDAHAGGVNYIDTADVYTKGASEIMVGELIKASRLDWVLATKLGNKMSDRVNEGHFSGSWMLREIDASLKRLQTDFVDVLYMHLDYNSMNLEEPLRALDAMLRAGKIRYWGVSNFRGWRIAEAVHVAAQLGMPKPVVCQPYYNLLNRMPEVEVLPACAFHGIGVTPLQPGRSGRAHRQICTRPETRSRHPRRAGRQAHYRHRISRGIPRDRAKAPGLCGRQRHHPGPICNRLGIGKPCGQLGDCRSTHTEAVAGLRACAGLHRDSRR